MPKKNYTKPLISEVALDNEIVLISLSGGNDLSGPGIRPRNINVQNSNMPETFQTDPFKTEEFK